MTSHSSIFSFASNKIVRKPFASIHTTHTYGINYVFNWNGMSERHSSARASFKPINDNNFVRTVCLFFPFSTSKQRIHSIVFDRKLTQKHKMPTTCKFENPLKIFYSGQPIKGKIEIHLTRVKKVHGIFIVFSGKGEKSYGKHIRQERYIKDREYLIGGINGKNKFDHFRRTERKTQNKFSYLFIRWHTLGAWHILWIFI